MRPRTGKPAVTNVVPWALTDAKVAELADAPDLGSGSRKALGVRLPPFARLSRSPLAPARVASAARSVRARVSCSHVRHNRYLWARRRQAERESLRSRVRHR